MGPPTRPPLLDPGRFLLVTLCPLSTLIGHWDAWRLCDSPRYILSCNCSPLKYRESCIFSSGWEAEARQLSSGPSAICYRMSSTERDSLSPAVSKGKSHVSKDKNCRAALTWN